MPPVAADAAIHAHAAENDVRAAGLVSSRRQSAILSGGARRRREQDQRGPGGRRDTPASQHAATATAAAADAAVRGETAAVSSMQPPGVLPLLRLQERLVLQSTLSGV